MSAFHCVVESWPFGRRVDETVAQVNQRWRDGEGRFEGVEGRYKLGEEDLIEGGWARHLMQDHRCGAVCRGYKCARREEEEARLGRSL